MFYDAMICDGVDTVKAMTMYMAVRTFGQKWGVPNPRAKAAKSFSTVAGAIDIDELEQIMDRVLGEQE